VESDAKQATYAVKDGGRNDSSFGQLVDGVLVALNSFPIWQIRHANREASMGARRLAELAVKQIVDTIWIEALPNSIRDIVLAE
jgi:hypothetical protein